MAGKLDGRKDYGLGENVPVENIDVQGPGRFYPDDYSAQINVYQRQRQYAASIPESFAKIVTDMDDYLTTAHSLEVDTEIEKQSALNRVDLGIQKLNMQTDVGNQVYDTYRQVQSDLDETKQKALAEGKSVEDAYAQQLENYRTVDNLSSPYASSMWSHMYNQLAGSALSEGRKIDTENIQYQMAANLNDAASDIRARLMHGDFGIDDAMNRFSAVLYPYLENLPAKQVDKMLRELYSSFVLGRADYLKVIMADDPKGLMTALSDLRDKYSKNTYYFLNNAGERLKNEFNLDYLKENWYVKGLAIYDDHIEFSIGIDAAENHEHDHYYDIYICVDFSTQEAEVTFNVVW